MMEPILPVHQAAKDGDIAALKKASKRELHRADFDGWTAAHWCAWRGNTEALEVVLSRGGDPNKPDDKGKTPLHIAAGYGNFDALQVLVSHRANLWALDNRGHHAAKNAAINKRLECCRYLDNIAIHLQTQHPDHVRSLQSKSLKDLERRVKEAQKQGSNHKAKRYPHATVPVKRTSSDPHLVPRSGKKVSAEEIARQNFVLQRPTVGEESTDNPTRDSGFVSQTVSAKNTFRPLPKMHSGAILNTLSDLARQPLRLKDVAQDNHSINSDPLHNRHSAASSSSSRPKKAVATLIPLPIGDEQDFMTENNSPLATFLNSLDLLEIAEILHREKMDMDALMLCNEGDLRSIGIGLGPRKKILNAVECRRQLLTHPGEMKDSEV